MINPSDVIALDQTMCFYLFAGGFVSGVLTYFAVRLGYRAGRWLDDRRAVAQASGSSHPVNIFWERLLCRLDLHAWVYSDFVGADTGKAHYCPSRQCVLCGVIEALPERLA